MAMTIELEITDFAASALIAAIAISLHIGTCAWFAVNCL
jgi:hypothetical protein